MLCPLDFAAQRVIDAMLDLTVPNLEGTDVRPPVQLLAHHHPCMCLPCKDDHKPRELCRVSEAFSQPTASKSAYVQECQIRLADKSNGIRAKQEIVGNDAG